MYPQCWLSHASAWGPPPAPLHTLAGGPQDGLPGSACGHVHRLPGHSCPHPVSFTEAVRSPETRRLGDLASTGLQVPSLWMRRRLFSQECSVDGHV